MLETILCRAEYKIYKITVKKNKVLLKFVDHVIIFETKLSRMGCFSIFFNYTESSF